MVSLLIIFEFSDFAGHVMEGVWGSQVSQNQQKHAQSPYLDEYLRFKKNLTEKFLLDKKIQHFEKSYIFFIGQ